ncbi:Major intrinsic protein [Prunus yedoensis var. nudiflora]|uniref:Major intrinsic protein n=1 Tax=Prunus yedoensis var. nudiflora TaxID=2094558 RepID=A0A314XKV5_PRUYE|nr:Major intrinsic protein [Prunus yedoensis var. nudiflora]
MSHDLEQKFLFGGCTLNGNGETHGISPGDAFLLEFVSTFLLLFVGITVAFDKKRSKEVGLPWVCFMLSAPMGRGVFISIPITGTAGYSGVGLNPARCLGPALKGLVVLEEEHDILSIGEACFKGISTPVYIQK